MEVTTTKHISKLDVAQPSGSAPISEADDHLRFIKDCIKQTFSGITSVGSGNVTADATELNTLDGYTGTTGDLNTIAGAVSSGLTTSDIAKLATVSVTAAELNRVTGLSSNITTLLSAKANLASPALTGTPTATTQATSDNSTKIATTAYVTAKTSGIPTSTNLADTNAAVALNTAYRGTNDTALALKANSASPTISDATLTGTPIAPTAGAGVNTTQIASTAFVQGLIATAIATAATNAAGAAYPVGSIYMTTTAYADGAAVVAALGLPASASMVRYAEGRTIVGLDTGVTVTVASASNDVVTLTVGSNHGYNVGDTVTVAGFTGTKSVLNGSSVVTNTYSTQIRYTNPSANTIGTFNVQAGVLAKHIEFNGDQETGGQTAHILQHSQVPDHNHQWNNYGSGANLGLDGSGSAPSNHHTYDTNGNAQNYQNDPLAEDMWTSKKQSVANGEAAQHKILQPYIVTHIWRRAS